MQRFVRLAMLVALLCALSVGARAADAKTPLITADNFVSLELFNRSDKDEPGYWLHLDNGGLRVKFRQAREFGFNRPLTDVWSEPAPLSRNQLSACLAFLNRKQILKLVGNYSGKSKVVGLAQILTLVVSDDKGRDQKFEIQNSGDEAPRAYYEVVEYLRDLQIQKFSERNLEIPAKDWVTTGNFQKLALEISGGFAGVRSTLEITPRPLFSSSSQHDDRWILNWSQTIAGRQTTQSGLVEPDQKAEIVRLVNALNFAKLDGQSFRQPGLADGFNETLTLTLGNDFVSSNRQTYTVSNYGNQSPPEFSALAQYLRELQRKNLDTAVPKSPVS